MNKAILISVRPKLCEKIANGQKTVEVRSTRPKLNPPFKVYIYCTKAEERLITVLKDGDENYGEIYHGKPVFIKTNNPDDFYAYGHSSSVIGEFTCDRIYEIRKRGIPENFDYCYQPLSKWGNDDIAPEINAISASCVSKEDRNAYGAGRLVLYGWHLTDLRIYATPRELSEFRRACPNSWYCESCAMYRENNGTCGNDSLQLRRPPQGWCYVEEVK